MIDSKRRGSRGPTDQKQTLRISPKLADGLSQFRKEAIEREIEGGNIQEGRNYGASNLYKDGATPRTTDSENLQRGAWLPGRSEDKKSFSNTVTAVAAIAHSEAFVKQAQGAAFSSSSSGGGTTAGASVERLAPEVYSPLFTMANLNLPRDRITVNAWCFLPETMVWMADGTRKAIEDVKIGDLVISGSGNIKKVSKLFRREISEEVVGIKIKGSQETIWTTKNHGFEIVKAEDVRCCNKTTYVKCKPSYSKEKFCKWCNRKKDPYIFNKISAENIEQRDCVYFPIPNFYSCEHKLLNTSDGAELLGYYAAEGSTSRGYQVVFTFGIEEKEQVDRVVFLLKKLFHVEPKIYKREDKSTYQIHTYKKKIANFFIKNCPGESTTKVLSKDAISMEPGLLLKMFVAWLDGDGSQEKDNYRIFAGNTSSECLATQMKLVALRCGLVAHIFRDHSQKKFYKNGKKYNAEPRYYVKIRGVSAMKLAECFSSSFYRFGSVERKYHRDGCAFIHNNKLIQYVSKKKKKHYDGIVYNIEVEEDHTYVVGAGVAVHNCRNFFQLHPIVRNAITLHATYPISKINFKCHNKKVLQFFEDMAEEMSLMQALGDLSLEYWKMGEKIQGSSLITMADGTLKPIRDIKVGEYVISHLGNKKKVIDRFIKPTNRVIEEHLKIYKVSVMGVSEPLIISGKHPILSTKLAEVLCETPSCRKKNMRIFPDKERCSNCRKKNTEHAKLMPQFVETNNISVKDIVYAPFNNDIVENKDFDEDMSYLMGYWLAEGCYCKAPRKNYTKYNGIKFTSFDKNYIEKELKPLLNCCTSFEGTTYTSKSTNFAVSKNKYDHWLEAEKRGGPQLARFFLHHCGEYSKEKKLSNEIMMLPPRLQLHLLAGFIDGDGCVDRSNGHFVIGTSSRDLANQIVLILRRAGGHPTISSVEEIPEENIAKKYRIKLVANEAYDMFKKLLRTNKSNLLYRTKWSSPNSSLYKNWQLLYITEIEDITDSFNEDFMYDIEVEDDHSYVANGIAIHNCFPYAELNEETGKWSNIVIQNPDYIHVKKTVLSGEPIVSLKPDAVLQRLVMSSNPADVQLRKQIPEKIIYHVRKGEDIPLDNFNVSHLKMLSSPYDVRGTSVIVSVFKDLMLYDKLREAKFAQADGLVNPITIVKVGGNTDGEYRATQEDLEFFRQMFEEAQYDKDFKLITHAGVTVERVGASGQVLDIGPDMELIIKNIYTGLMVPPAVVDTESAVYASASIGLEVLRQRYFNFRNMMAQWLQSKIFAPISEINDFYDYEGGSKRLIVPEVEWNQMNLYDLQDYIANISGLVANKQVSLQTLYKSLGLSYEDERVNIRQEMINDEIRNRENESLRKMTIAELRTLDPEKEVMEPIDNQERAAAGGMPPEAGGMPGGTPAEMAIPGGLGELAPPPGGEMGGGPPGGGAPEIPGGAPPLGPGGPGGGGGLGGI